MSDTLNLGDLRKLVERLADQDDSVPVGVIVAIPGLQTTVFELGRARTAPVEYHVDATAARIKQAEGYIHGHGPASGIVIYGGGV